MNLKSLYYIIPGFLLISALSLGLGIKGIGNLEKSLIKSAEVRFVKYPIERKDYFIRYINSLEKRQFHKI